MPGSVSGFALAVSTAIGVNVTAIQGFVNNWIAFYSAIPGATQGLTVAQAAYGVRSVMQLALHSSPHPRLRNGR